MGYYIDLSLISIEEYKNKLKNKILIPSRLILREKIDERFKYFKEVGIKSVLDLLQSLKKKEKFEALSEVPILSKEYLTILLREIKSLHPEPNKFSDITGIPNDVITKLEKYGIKNTAQLFDKVLTKESRKETARLIQIDDISILELTKLTDISRIQWVNSTFARILYESGYDTTEKVSKANYEELYESIKMINAEKRLYKGNIGLNDMKICVEAAKDVSLDIQY